MTLFLSFSCHSREVATIFCPARGSRHKKYAHQSAAKKSRKKKTTTTNQSTPPPLLQWRARFDPAIAENSKHAHTTGGLQGPPRKTVPASKPSGIRKFRNSTRAAWRLVVQPQSQHIEDHTVRHRPGPSRTKKAKTKYIKNTLFQLTLLPVCMYIRRFARSTSPPVYV